MQTECSALELRARLALLAAPDGVLSEGALSKALGKTTKAARDALLAKLESARLVTIEPARRGRRVKLSDREAAITADLRTPARARFSGSVVNALLARLAQRAPTGPPSAPLRDRVLTAHEMLARQQGDTVTLASLRASLDDIDSAELDRILIELDREGVIALGRAVDLANLDESARAGAIHDTYRGALVFVSRAATAEPKP